MTTSSRHLYPKVLLAATSSLIYFGIVEYDTTFNTTQWVSWLFFTAVNLAALLLYPKLIPPFPIHATIRKLVMVVIIALAVFLCWLSEFNLIQTAAYSLSWAMLVLGMKLDTCNSRQSNSMTNTPQRLNK